jgi:hypothetical protein
MLAIAIIGFLVFAACLGLLLWSVIKKKIKRYWILGIIVSFVFFIIGAANLSGAYHQTVPFINSNQQEAEFKNSTQPVNIKDLAEFPETYSGKAVTFTGLIGSFLKDANGIEQGININDPNDNVSSVEVYLSVIDLAKVNISDSITIWGKESGYVTGDNAYGANIMQQVTESEWYLRDNTNGYSSGAIQAAYLANDGMNKEISTDGLSGSTEGLDGLPGQPYIGVWVNVGTETAPVWQSETMGNYDTDTLGKISQASEADNPSKVDCLWNRVSNTLIFAVAPPILANAVTIQYTVR